MNGDLISDPRAIAQEWLKVTELLGKDTLNSKNRGHWERVLRDTNLRTKGSKEENEVFSEVQLSDIFDAPPTWNEIATELRKLGMGKAEGPNGISGEFLKAALKGEEVMVSEGIMRVPKVVGLGPRAGNHLGKIILVLLNRIWEEVKIPGSLRDAEVVYILQKDEARCMDN